VKPVANDSLPAASTVKFLGTGIETPHDANAFAPDGVLKMERFGNLTRVLPAVLATVACLSGASKPEAENTPQSSGVSGAAPLKISYFGRYDKDFNGRVGQAGEQVNLIVKLSRKVKQSDVNGNGVFVVNIEDRRLIHSKPDDFLDKVVAITYNNGDEYYGKFPDKNLEFQVGQNWKKISFVIQPNASQPDPGTSSPYKLLKSPEYTLFMAFTGGSPSASTAFSSHVVTTQGWGTTVPTARAAANRCRGSIMAMGVSKKASIQEAYTDAIAKAQQYMMGQGCADVILQTRLRPDTIRSAHGGFAGMNRTELWIEAWWGMDEPADEPDARIE